MAEAIEAARIRGGQAEAPGATPGDASENLRPYSGNRPRSVRHSTGSPERHPCAGRAMGATMVAWTKSSLYGLAAGSAMQCPTGAVQSPAPARHVRRSIQRFLRSDDPKPCGFQIPQHAVRHDLSLTGIEIG
jgi:hypothetical protein